MEKLSRSFETQDLYFNQNSWRTRGSGMKRHHFLKRMRGKKFPPGCCRGGFASLLTCSPLGPLVVALESFHHKQLAQILRGKLLHVLAVVVDLPCWRGKQHGSSTPTRQQHTNTTHTVRDGGGAQGEKNMKLVEIRWPSEGRRSEQLETATKWAVGVGDVSIKFN